MEGSTFEEKTVEKVFHEEKQKWESKMVKIFGDLRPYQHVLTKSQTQHAPAAEDSENEKTIGNDEADIFAKLSSTYKADKKAEEEFHKVLAEIDISEVSLHMSDFLENQKKECVEVLQQFDKVIELCEKYFQLEYESCREREKEQMLLQESTMKEVERYLSQVEEAGDQEISHLKESISKHIGEVGEMWSRKIGAIYQDIDKNSQLVDLWNDRIEAITSKDLLSAFVEDQRETAFIWRNAYEDLMMLSTELEKYRYNYTKTKSNMERSIYWMQRNYRDNIPELTKVQKHMSFLVSRKTHLSEELQSISEEIEKEEMRRKDIERQYTSKIATLQDIKKQATSLANSKHKNVFESKQCEISDFLSEILKGDKFIFEEILLMPWSPPKTSKWNEKKNIESEPVESEDVDSLISIKTLKDDKFADAFRLLISNRDFEVILNRIAEELGFMLNFEWVDYAKKTLEIKDEIKWIELFKVFKLDFEEDLKDLKDHMMKFTKRNDVGELVFDGDSTVEGFIEFVSEKKHQLPARMLEKKKEVPKYEDIDWNSIQTSIPEIHLWDSIISLLKKYRDFLTSRQHLLAIKMKVETENAELEKILANYYSYDIPD